MNMLLGAASTGQAEQHKPGIIQYQYTNVNAVHPMNLATTTSAGPSVVQTTTIDPVALVCPHHFIDRISVFRPKMQPNFGFGQSRNRVLVNAVHFFFHVQT